MLMLISTFTNTLRLNWRGSFDLQKHYYSSEESLKSVFQQVAPVTISHALPG